MGDGATKLSERERPRRMTPLVAGGVPVDPEPAAPLVWRPTFRDLHRRLGGGGKAVDGMVPAVLFVALNSTAGLTWGIGGAMLGTVAVMGHRRRQGVKLNPLMWVTLGFVVIPGLIGIISGSSDVFFAPGVIIGFLVAAAMGGSVVIGKPAVGAAVNAIWPLPEHAKRNPQVVATFRKITIVSAVISGISAAAQLWLLLNLSASAFAVAREGVNLGTSVPMIALSFLALRRTADIVEGLSPIPAA
jgi:intracellular septation protein A